MSKAYGFRAGFTQITYSKYRDVIVRIPRRNPPKALTDPIPAIIEAVQDNMSEADLLQFFKPGKILFYGRKSLRNESGDKP